MIINHGVRGSIPTPSHKMLGYGGNTPCVEVKTSDYQLIFDCGSGFSKVDFDNDWQRIAKYDDYDIERLLNNAPDKRDVRNKEYYKERDRCFTYKHMVGR